MHSNVQESGALKLMSICRGAQGQHIAAAQWAWELGGRIFWGIWPLWETGGREESAKVGER
jgi:hypothetical protein